MRIGNETHLAMKKRTGVIRELFPSLLFAIVLPVLISCSKSNQAMRVSNENYRSYLALGDSYTIGESVAEADRFPNQVVTLLRSQQLTINDPRIIATTGWTTRNLIDAVNAAGIPENYDVVTLLIGVNNQYQGRSIEEYKIEFTSLLSRAIQFARNRPTHVFVLSIPDYSVTPFASNSDKKKIAAEIDKFNAENKKISIQLGVNYIDITPVSREPDPALIAGDGLHPSGKQYKRWAEVLVPVVKQFIQ